MIRKRRDYWHPIADAPLNEWLITKREGRETMCRGRYYVGDPAAGVEWINHETGRPVAAMPTHWRFLVEEQDAPHR